MAGKKKTAEPQLRWIPLAEIAPHSSIRQEVEKADIPDLGVSDNALRILSVIRPVVVVSAGPNQFEAIAGVQMLAWHLHRARSAGDSSAKVLATLVPGEGVKVESYRVVDRHLGPLVLGELATRSTRAARKALKGAGSRDLQPVPLRDLRPIER